MIVFAKRSMCRLAGPGETPRSQGPESPDCAHPVPLNQCTQRVTDDRWLFCF